MENEKLKQFNNKYVQVKTEKFTSYGKLKIKANKVFLIEFDKLDEGDYIEFETEYLPNKIIDIHEEEDLFHL